MSPLLKEQKQAEYIFSVQRIETKEAEIDSGILISVVLSWFMAYQPL